MTLNGETVVYSGREDAKRKVADQKQLGEGLLKGKERLVIGRVGVKLYALDRQNWKKSIMALCARRHEEDT